LTIITGRYADKIGEPKCKENGPFGRIDLVIKG
jgi:hypothetical protein